MTILDIGFIVAISILGLGFAISIGGIVEHNSSIKKKDKD